MIALFRTLIFAPLAILTTLIASVLVLLTAIFPMRVRFAIIRVWYTVVLGLCKTVLGLRYRLLGREHIPSGACVVLAKHESAWETIALQQIFPPVVFVLKKSLLNIPILGFYRRADDFDRPQSGPRRFAASRRTRPRTAGGRHFCRDLSRGDAHIAR